ncbi:MAG: cupin domain-containing protein [Candidatus Saccharimonadaceae bacterium]
MNKELVKSNIKTNVYQINCESNVSLHKHKKFDEVFYCIKGKGFGVLENEEKELNVGDAFIVKENTMQALRSESEMWVASFLIPIIDQI